MERAFWSSLAFQIDISRTNDDRAHDVPKSSTITIFASASSRPSNGMLVIYRDPELYTVLVAGSPPTEEEFEGASKTRKEGVGTVRRAGLGVVVE